MINSTLCYLEKDGQYLMLLRNRKPSDVNEGKWIGVGGKFEEGEGPEDCLIREIREETGLTLRSYRFRSVVTFRQIGHETEYMHLFTSDDFFGDLIPCDEGELHWILKSEIGNLELWEGDRIFLDLLAEDAPFFLLTLLYDGDTLIHSKLTVPTDGIFPAKETPLP